ncbi:hypothetical protein [Allosphingosinicella vermicomposti]|uniref:hypothetical protein n=1 Tax=Allosphingosinicella vermicomposti TaxID=614671 RepID=UPI000D10CAFE|nr:hypothetical protein [Allosphingosinicella vermicomposti]
MTKTSIRDDETITTEHSETKGRFSSAADNARNRASDAYRAARERTGSAYSSARSRASSATQRTSDAISANPVAAVVGGLAIGAVVAALLPKTQREVQALGATGARLTDKAREAAKSATDAGREKLDELGYAVVKEKIGAFVGGKASEA